MQSRVARDVYETDEPQNQFNKRVQHCTQMYNETVRAMRYPPGAHRKGGWYLLILHLELTMHGRAGFGCGREGERSRDRSADPGE